MMKNNPDDYAKYLEWDSTFFNKRIARVNGNFLTSERVECINQWSKDRNIDCLYFLATINDDQTVICAEKDGYHFVDLRITLEVQSDMASDSLVRKDNIRFAQISDIQSLCHIAGTNHTNSRFFTDSHFDRGKCQKLYGVWIEKSVRSRHDRVFVWEVQDQAVAYVTTAINNDRKSGQIELVGIAPEWQKKGIGRELVAEALSYFTKNRVQTITTVTQGRNIHALKLYQKCGFSIRSIEIWYHKWF